jgi:hypothetical protein
MISPAALNCAPMLNLSVGLLSKSTRMPPMISMVGGKSTMCTFRGEGGRRGGEKRGEERGENEERRNERRRGEERGGEEPGGENTLHR